MNFKEALGICSDFPRKKSLSNEPTFSEPLNQVVQLSNQVSGAMELPEWGWCNNTILGVKESLLTVSQLAESIDSDFSHNPFSKILEEIRILPRICEVYGNYPLNETHFFNRNIQLDNICSYAVEASVLLPEEERDQAVTSVQQISSKSKMELSVSDLIALAGILISLILGLMALQPDNQLEDIKGQNDVLINQQAEFIKSHNQTVELENQLIDLHNQNIDKLVNAIGLLSDEIHLLRDELQSVHDAEELEPQSNDKEPQE